MEKFVTDLDKLLDDFESSNDDLNCDRYDSSGYNSPRVTTDLNLAETDPGCHTPTLTGYESFTTCEQLTPTTNGPRSIIDGQSSVVCVLEDEERHTSLDETIVNDESDSKTSSFIGEMCVVMKENNPMMDENLPTLNILKDPNVVNNTTMNSSTEENFEHSICSEVLQNSDNYSQASINGMQTDRRRTVGDFLRDHGSLIYKSPNHSLVPPRKKSRPNSLLGLSSVIDAEQNCEEKTEFLIDTVVVESQVSQNKLDNIQIHSIARRPQSLNLDEDIAANSIMSDCVTDVHTESCDCENQDDGRLISEDKVSENSLPIHQFESIERTTDECNIWQGIPVDELGLKEPVWISDETSVNCMQCNMPFSMFRRRHHCRACGRLLCNKCCCWRMQLHFSNKLFPKDRVCAVCFQYLIRVEAAKKHGQNTKSSNFQPLSSVLKSNRPTSLTISPNSMSSSSNKLVPDLVEASNALKSVMFADGIRPGGDLMESDKSRIITPTKFQSTHQIKSITRHSPELTSREPSLLDDKEENYLFCQCKEKLIFHQTSSGCENDSLIFAITRNLNVHLQIIKLPYCTCSFKNKVHNVVGHQECDCDSVDCWFFASIGLETIGVEEIVVVLRRLPDEVNPPIEIFKYYFQVYQRAFKNETKADNMEMTVEILSENNNHLSEWAGILHIRPTFQCLNKIPTIRSPFLIGILIHRWELPWAMLLPLRLVLALGNQSRFYPCSIVSDRDRPSVYGEVGQTILQLVSPLFAFSNNLERGLCDATIVPTVPGMWLHLIASQETIVQIPKQSYSCLLNILSSRPSENSPMALAASFSREADSHLVCCQNEETGQYFSTAISIQNTERMVTATTMILFVPCRDNEEHGTSIVEDAIVVKLSQMHLGSILNSIRTMSDLALQCGSSKNDLLSKAYGSSPSLRRSMIKIVWTDSQQMCDMASIERASFVTDDTIQAALGSLRDGGDKIIKSHRVPSSLQNVSSDKENQSPTNPKLVWTRFHMVETGNSFNDFNYEDPVDVEEIIREIAFNFANSINPFLDMLRDMKLVKIGLRTKIGCDNVDWSIGCSKKYQYILSPEQSPVDESDPRSNSFVSSKMKSDHKVHFNNVEAFPEACRDYLNEVMVPFIYSKTALLRNGSLISELEFHIID